VFALTMASDDDKKQLQDMWAEIDGLVTDIKTIHSYYGQRAIRPA
jgi:archaellum component FlaC